MTSGHTGEQSPRCGPPGTTSDACVWANPIVALTSMGIKPHERIVANAIAGGGEIALMNAVVRADRV